MSRYADLPKSWCHGCGVASSLHGDSEIMPDGKRPPEPGDITVCSSCGEINVFNDILVLEKPDDLDVLLGELSPKERHALDLIVAQVKRAPTLEE